MRLKEIIREESWDKIWAGINPDLGRMVKSIKAGEKDRAKFKDTWGANKYAMGATGATAPSYRELQARGRANPFANVDAIKSSTPVWDLATLAPVGKGVAIGSVAAQQGYNVGKRFLSPVMQRIRDRVAGRAHKSLDPAEAEELRRGAEKLEVVRSVNNAHKKIKPNEVKIVQRVNKARRRMNKAVLQTGFGSTRTAKAAEKLRYQHGVAQQTLPLARNVDRARPKNLRRLAAAEKARHNKEMNLNKEFQHRAKTQNDYLSGRNADYVARQAPIK